jgi:hypothetical protein
MVQKAEQYKDNKQYADVKKQYQDMASEAYDTALAKRATDK